MKLIKVTKPISFSPLIEQDSYIPYTEIIAIAVKNNTEHGFIYHDLDNKPVFWSWQKLSDQTGEQFENQIGNNFLSIKNTKDEIYSCIKINPQQIKTISKNCYNENITDFTMFGENLTFSHDGNLQSVLCWFWQFMIKNFNFCHVNTPVGEYYINTKRINSIQVEDYTSIKPEEIDFYLKENGFGDKSQLFHIIFDDASFFTILGESIEKVCTQIWSIGEIINE